MKCPKCGYERQATDSAPAWQCPSCDVAYAKALPSNTTNAAPIPNAARQAQERDRASAPAASQEEDTDELLSLAARGQKIVIYSIVLNFVLRAADRSQVLPPYVLDILSICIAIYTLVGVVRICSGLGKSQNQKILFMILSWYPIVNLVSLIYLSLKTTKVLRAAGMEVGLLGVKQ